MGGLEDRCRKMVTLQKVWVRRETVWAAVAVAEIVLLGET